MPAEYVPTVKQRLVENAAAFGITQAEIANQLGIQEKTLRKHFRGELSSGKFEVDMLAGKTLVELMKSRDEREATKCYTARRMGWKETTAQQVTGADNGPVQFEDVTPAVDRIRSRISSIAARLGEGG